MIRLFWLEPGFRCKPQAGFKFTVILHYLPKYGKAVPSSPTRGLNDQRLQTSLEETILPNAYGERGLCAGKGKMAEQKRRAVARGRRGRGRSRLEW